MPYLRATMTGDTPGCKLSAAISRFCSAVQRRRRSRPVITSMGRLRMLVRLVVGASSDSNATAVILSSFLKDDRWPDFPRAAQCADATSLTKDVEDGQEINLRAQVVDLPLIAGSLKPRSSLVLVPDEQGADRPDQNLTKTERSAKRFLADLIVAEGKHLPYGGGFPSPVGGQPLLTNRPDPPESAMTNHALTPRPGTRSSDAPSRGCSTRRWWLQELTSYGSLHSCQMAATAHP